MSGAVRLFFSSMVGRANVASALFCFLILKKVVVIAARLGEWW